jgi:hypothetical protein
MTMRAAGRPAEESGNQTEPDDDAGRRAAS